MREPVRSNRPVGSVLYGHCRALTLLVALLAGGTMAERCHDLTLGNCVEWDPLDWTSCRQWERIQWSAGGIMPIGCDWYGVNQATMETMFSIGGQFSETLMGARTAMLDVFGGSAVEALQVAGAAAATPVVAAAVALNINTCDNEFSTNALQLAVYDVANLTGQTALRATEACCTW